VSELRSASAAHGVIDELQNVSLPPLKATLHEVEVADNDRQHVIEVVSQAARQLAHRRKLLRLRQIGLRSRELLGALHHSPFQSLAQVAIIPDREPHRPDKEYIRCRNYDEDQKGDEFLMGDAGKSVLRLDHDVPSRQGA
jgi:hypothetical protein